MAQGSLRGQVIWSGKERPLNPEVGIGRDKDHCLKQGKIFRDELIVSPKNKGIKNVVFWLVDAKDPERLIPTPATLQGKQVVIDIPCCVFVNRLTVLLDTQELVVKNSSPVNHNFHLHGGPGDPRINLALPTEKEQKMGLLRPRLFPPLPCSCAIHPWMKGYVLALNSPYYAFTNAEGNFEIKNVPAGSYRLVGWHERIGWIFPAGAPKNCNIPVTIEHGKTLELRPLSRKVEDD